MTLIAGIVSRRPGVPVPVDVCETLRRSISRHNDADIRTFGDESAFFAKLDIGAFHEPAEVVDEQGNITLLAGEPLLSIAGRVLNAPNRADETKTLHDSLTRNDTTVLDSVTGVFNAVHYNPATGELLLVADKLGLRPLYYHLSDKFVILAGALRVLEKVASIEKTMDVRGVAEIISLGYALDGRTPYIGISTLRPAEIVRIKAGSVTSERYFRWDKIAKTTMHPEDLVREVHVRFEQAVSRRIGNDQTTAAYLSGGLDSRCIVAALMAHGASVHTFNFSRPGTQDQVFGREFAYAIGAFHREAPKQAGDITPDYAQLLADEWSATPTDARLHVERPNVVWSGEGGSLVLGHVGPTEELVKLLRAGEVDRAIEEHLATEWAQLPMRVFRNDVADEIARTFNEGLKKEFVRFENPDPGRNLYLFVLLNEQHRKLVNHFENIDLNRLEFQLPFYDSSFIKLVVSAPIDMCLGHRLYGKWLELLQPAVRAVPWQAYPGHEPCPLPIPEHLDVQWDTGYQAAQRAARKKLVMAQADELRRGRYLPQDLLSKWNLRFASIVHVSGLRDYGYLIGSAHVLHTYALKCAGRYDLGTRGQ